MKKILSVLLVLIPWKLRRILLVRFWKYEIHPTAKIGIAYVYPKKLIMRENAIIEHFTVAIHLDLLLLGNNSQIGRSNWITGFPSSGNSLHFGHQKGVRSSELIIDDHSAITKHHHIDCTNSIRIGRFTTIAGYYSQLLTHSINIEEGRQDSRPIQIGDYCFIGTNSVILGGSELPSYTVLGAKSLLNKAFDQRFALYAGTPATLIKSLQQDAKYFTRQTGYVY